MLIEQSVYSINTAATVITHLPRFHPNLTFTLCTSAGTCKEHHDIFFFFSTCVPIGAFPDGKNGRQLLSAHWLQLEQPFPLLMGWGLTVFQYLQFGRG